MDLSIRSLNDTDYQDILVGWWNDWGMSPVPKDFLPEDGKGGIMVMDGETPVCAGFMYATNSKVAWVDWIISSKTYRKKPQRNNAVRLLISSLTSIASKSGYIYSYALIKNSSSLTKTYVDLGYNKSCVYTNELIKKLWE
jgi:hypothetical protein